MSVRIWIARAGVLGLLAACGGKTGGDKPSCKPGSTDVCDGQDNDCDGAVDEDAEFQDYYLDYDGDGYGVGAPVRACEPADDLSLIDGDCDDSDPDIHPLAAELCNGVDDDCDDLVDDGDPDISDAGTWYLDADGDGYGGDPGVYLCEPPSGMTQDGGDCDDTDASINPDAAEICDGVDDDCDGLVDDEDTDADGLDAWYLDADDDGYGTSDDVLMSCSEPTGYSSRDGDCDDSDGATHPGATEICDDGIDNDCDGGGSPCLPYDGTLSRSDADVTIKSASGSTFHTSASGGDLTGDGSADLVLSDYANSGNVYLFEHLLPGEGLTTDDAWVISGDSTWTSFGDGVWASADLDADGYDDLLTSATGSALLFFSGPISSDLAASDNDYAITNLSIAGAFAQQVAAADLTGDGVTDMLVGDPYTTSADGTTSTGSVTLLKGPLSSGDSDPLSDLSEAVITGDSSSGYTGWAVDTADVDGDGTADALLTAKGTSSYGYTRGGAAYIFLGGAITGSLDVADADAIIYGSSSYAEVGYAASMGGDQDGDGHADLALASPGDSSYGAGAVYVLDGPFTSGAYKVSSADAVIYNPNGTSYFGYAVDMDGDLNGDGKADLLLGDLGYSDSGYSYGGAVRIAYGDIVGATNTVDATIGGTGSSQYYGAGVRYLGDLDADGFEDFTGIPYGSTDLEVYMGGDGR